MNDTNLDGRYAALIEAIRDALDVHPSIERLLGGTPQAWHNVGRELGFIGGAPQPAPDASDLVELVRDFLDPEPCSHDHHGYCQQHNWFDSDTTCPHARARLLLDYLPNPRPIALGKRYRFTAHQADEIVTPYEIVDDHVHYVLAEGGYDGSCRVAHWHENTVMLGPGVAEFKPDPQPLHLRRGVPPITGYLVPTTRDDPDTHYIAWALNDLDWLADQITGLSRNSIIGILRGDA